MSQRYWAPLHKDLVDLVTDETITLPQFGLYSALACLADYKSGDVVVKLVKLQSILQWGASDDTLLRDLHKLRAAGLIEFEVRERQRKPWRIHVPAAMTEKPSNASTASELPQLEGADLRQTRGRRAADARQTRGSGAAVDPSSTAAAPQTTKAANPQPEDDSTVSQLPQRGTRPEGQEEEVRVENVEGRKEQSCLFLPLDDADASSSPSDSEDHDLSEEQDQDRSDEESRLGALEVLVADIEDADDGTFSVFDKISRPLHAHDIEEAHRCLKRRRRPRSVDGEQREPLVSEAAFVNRVLQDLVVQQPPSSRPGARLRTWLKDIGIDSNDLASDFADWFAMEHLDGVRQAVESRDLKEGLLLAIACLKEAERDFRDLKESRDQLRNERTQSDAPEHDGS